MRGFDKWEAYFPVYQRVISRVVPGSAYLEIGVQNLGWLGAFDTERKFVRCVACDINPKVAKYAEGTRFTDVIIGDSTSEKVYQQIKSLNMSFDMIVDDASHTQHDIIKNFLLYFPLLRDGGAFLIEDCHTDFSAQFSETNYFGISVYEFFASLAALPTLVAVNPSLRRRNAAFELMRRFCGAKYGEENFSSIKEIAFANSCILISKGDSGLGKRVLKGDDWPVVPLQELRSFDLTALKDSAPPPAPDLAVVYLNRVTDAQEEKGRNAFIEGYRRYRPELAHQLYVVNKGFAPEHLPIQYELFSEFAPSFIQVIDEGYDLTAYQTAADFIEEPVVLFLNTYSEPLHEGWLEKLHDAFRRPGVGLAGFTGSLETHHPMRANFPAFPNFHIRTTGFMIDTERFRKIASSRSFLKKDDAYQFEGGMASMTRAIEAENLAAAVVGKNGAYFKQNLKRARIFRAGRQGDLLVADNHTREYAELSIMQKMRTWGNTWYGLTRLNPHVLKWNLRHGPLQQKLKRLFLTISA